MAAGSLTHQEHGERFRRGTARVVGPRFQTRTGLEDAVVAGRRVDPNGRRRSCELELSPRVGLDSALEVQAHLRAAGERPVPSASGDRMIIPIRMIDRIMT